VESHAHRAGRLPDRQPDPVLVQRGQKFNTRRPSFADDQLWENLTKHNVTVTAEPVVQHRSFLANLLISPAPKLLLVVLWIFIARRMRAGMGSAGGIDEVEGELNDVVDFLKNPDAYRKMGARMPRGVLLAGPPGTGKTLLARDGRPLGHERTRRLPVRPPERRPAGLRPRGRAADPGRDRRLSKGES